jgi:AcrR family transcriptional regulator
MARNAQETKRRIFDAAVEEFSRHGIAGARVDRITEAAGVNNALLYRYFGSKRELFDVVFGELSMQLVEAVRLDVDDLPGYVDALIRYYARHPDIVRISDWYRLERGDDEPPAAIVESMAAKVKLIAQAQGDGRLTDAIPASTLLEMLLSLAKIGTSHLPSGSTASARASAASRRRSVATAVEAILADAGAAPSRPRRQA